MSSQVIDCLTSHRSIRRFKPDPIPDDVIESIVRAGTRAATAGNLQMYSFLVLDAPEKIALFEQHLQPMIGRPPLIIVALLDLHRIRRWLEVAGAREPILDRPAYFMLGLCDTLFALQNVVVAAESRGLGTCYWGAILEFDLERHFGTPEYVFPAGLVCVGYPDEEPELRGRLPLEAVMHRNRYRDFDDDTIRRLYREREALWDTISEERRQKLVARGITSIPQSIAEQRFTEEPTRRRSRGIIDNLRRAGFRFEL